MPRREASGPLSAAFLGELGAKGTDLSVEQTLFGLLELARAASPDVDLDPVLFARHLGAKVRGEPSPLEALSKLNYSDLYLACACIEGDDRALARVQHRFRAQLARYFSSRSSSAELADEVSSVLLERLFVGKEGPPKIATYGGRAPLEAWLRILITRTAFELKRGSARADPLDENAVEFTAATDSDPELAFIKRRYAKEFRDAFRRVLTNLGTRERNVLRMYFLDGMTTDSIGALHKVHRTTVARWIDSARADILAQTRQSLRERLKLKPSEVDSLMAMVRSRADVGISALFRSLRSSPPRT